MNLTHSRWGRLATRATLVVTVALTLLGSLDLGSIGTVH
jgi:hypothetical protein